MVDFFFFFKKYIGKVPGCLQILTDWLGDKICDQLVYVFFSGDFKVLCVCECFQMCFYQL